MNEDSFHLGIKALIRNSSGHILLLKVNVALLKNYKGEPYWDIPGGRVQKGATIEDTLKREVEEETGINTIQEIEPVAMVLSNNIRIPVGDGDVGLILSIYNCNLKAEPSEIKLSEEHTDARWFTPQEASELLRVKYPQELTSKIAIT